jgi:hypothetical protein
MIYDHSCSIEKHCAGKLHRLREIFQFYVRPGDMLKIDLSGVIRMATNRRYIIRDYDIDFFFFFQPYRHHIANQDDWFSFLSDPLGETPFPKAPYSVPTDAMVHCLSDAAYGGSVPSFVIDGYVDIWNYFFRRPTWDNEKTANDLITTYRLDGFETFYKPSDEVTNGINRNAGIGLYSNGNFKVPIDTVNRTFNLQGLKEKMIQYERQMKTVFDGLKYKEFMKSLYNKRVSDEIVDKRPTLLFQKTFTSSGYEINGTDSTTLGTYVGKSVTDVSHSLPTFMPNEHGVVRVLATVRSKPLYSTRRNPLTSVGQPTAKQMMALQDHLDMPEYYEMDDAFLNASAGEPLGDIPAHVLKTKPHSTYDRYFTDALGFPMIDVPTTRDEVHGKGLDSRFDTYFSDTSLGHWQLNSSMTFDFKRMIPDGTLKIDSLKNLN